LRKSLEPNDNVGLLSDVLEELSTVASSRNNWTKFD
jgi:hypothetical protein